MFRGRASTAHAKRAIRASQAKVAVGLLAAATIAVAAGWLLATGGGSSGPKAGAPRALPARPTVQQRQTPSPSGPPPATTVATVVRSTPGYASPGLLAKDIVPASRYGRPSVLPVIGTQPGWVRVRLAQRPNGSTAWLPDRDVTITWPRTTLAPGASMTCHATHAISAVDLAEGSIFNSAAATGHPPIGGSVNSEPAYALATAVKVAPLPEVPVTG